MCSSGSALNGMSWEFMRVERGKWSANQQTRYLVNGWGTEQGTRIQGERGGFLKRKKEKKIVLAFYPQWESRLMDTMRKGERVKVIGNQAHMFLNPQPQRCYGLYIIWLATISSLPPTPHTSPSSSSKNMHYTLLHLNVSRTTT